MVRGDRAAMQDALVLTSPYVLVLLRDLSHDLPALGALKSAAEKASIQCIESTASFDLRILKASQIIIAGSIAGSALIELCAQLRQLQASVMVVVDATTCGAATQLELERLDVQITKFDAVLSLFETGNRFVYAYPKTEAGASVVVYLPKSKRVVLIERNNEPYKGMMAFPAGFLRPMMEDLPSCAARETFEECGIRIAPRNMRLVSVRSNPDRDPRGHVIDHGFLTVIESEERVVQTLCAGDDASDVRLVPIEEAMNMQLAADHNALLADVVALLTVSESHRFGWFEKVFAELKTSFKGILKGATSKA